MKRDQIEHVLRAAGAITGVRSWVIVGSQAILGAWPDAADELLVSQEVDLYSPEDEDAADLIDGSIGEKSPFHETFGYYAHGVGNETAVLPAKWRDRAVVIDTPGTAGTIGVCPAPADLAISKIAAWRDKDKEFVRTLVQHGIITIAELEARLNELDAAVRDLVARRLTGI